MKKINMQIKTPTQIMQEKTPSHRVAMSVSVWLCVWFWAIESQGSKGGPRGAKQSETDGCQAEISLENKPWQT